MSESGLRTLGICRLPNLIGPGGFCAWMLERCPVGAVMSGGGSPGGGPSPCGTRALELLESISASSTTILASLLEAACKDQSKLFDLMWVAQIERGCSREK